MDSGNSGSLSMQSSIGGGGGGGGVEESPLSALLRQPLPATSSSAQPGLGGSFYSVQEVATLPPTHAPHYCRLPAGAIAAGAVSPSLPSSSSPWQASAGQDAPAQAPVAAPPRGSRRKRMRASRRAPTTVMTTDTSNFRTMVQEFTGVPAPPYAGGGPSSARSRLSDHLFPSRSTATALSPYLLRPFAQKLQTPSSFKPPFIAATTSTTSSSSPANGAIATSTAPRTTAVASSDSYQLASAAPSNFLGVQDHSTGSYLSFQSPMFDGNAARYPAAHPMFDVAGPPSAHQKLAHGAMSSTGTTQLHPRHRDHGNGGGDELSGLVGAASVPNADGGCKATSYASGAEPPLLQRNAHGTTPVGAGAATTAMRAQCVDSWICTSE